MKTDLCPKNKNLSAFSYFILVNNYNGLISYNDVMQFTPTLFFLFFVIFNKIFFGQQKAEKLVCNNETINMQCVLINIVCLMEQELHVARVLETHRYTNKQTKGPQQALTFEGNCEE